MKKLLLFTTLSLIAFAGFSQWDHYSTRSVAKSNDYFVVSGSGHSGVTQKMTLTTLTHISDSTREAAVNSLEYNIGLSTLGKYQLNASSNNLNASKFLALSYTQNINNAIKLLDATIDTINLWKLGGGEYSVVQKSCQDTATGSYAVALNYQNESKGSYSLSSGKNSVAYLPGMKAHASGTLNEWGGNQVVEVVQYLSTTDATADTLTISGVNNSYLTIPIDMVGSFEITIMGVVNTTPDADVGASYSYAISGLCKNVAGTSSLVGAVDTTLSIVNDASFGGSAVVTIDNTSDAIIIEVTGEGKTIYWTASIRMLCTGFRNFSIE